MRARSRALYVETVTRADIETVWALTQDPVAHPRWDLRFSAIVPLETDARGRIRFRYERTLPFHRIDGTGVSLGERARPDGARTSALAFTTDDRLSPLRSGRGYWRYEPTAGGVRFITGYDYVPGFGRLPDILLRPIVRWMTAWSFDRLRIWAETGVPPERWGLRTVFAWWRPERPRAARCRTRSPRGGAMAGAPATLDELQPGGRP
ncbi:SRPBCC family protein [Herbiconiux sp. 11R-BC]|uniref:SRPBCC family protein n=1 Tax=Herbiconiux sp. 11R-BC TaxID=3111637 RepID=UPI003C0D6F79